MKMVYQRVTGWTLGQSLHINKFLEYTLPPRIWECVTVTLFSPVLASVCHATLLSRRERVQGQLSAYASAKAIRAESGSERRMSISPDWNDNYLWRHLKTFQVGGLECLWHVYAFISFISSVEKRSRVLNEFKQVSRGERRRRESSFNMPYANKSVSLHVPLCSRNSFCQGVFHNISVHFNFFCLTFGSGYKTMWMWSLQEESK